MGRDFAGQRFGPRPIDLDIIFYGDQHYQVQMLLMLRRNGSGYGQPGAKFRGGGSYNTTSDRVQKRVQG